MTTTVLPQLKVKAAEPIALAVLDGLSAQPRHLPPWLFYDRAGSRLFDEITELPEYYLTRTERGILAAHADAMTTQAAEGKRLRIVELGAGSADKTRLLLKAAVAQQGAVRYEPVDVSSRALEAARERIEREIAGVSVVPRVMDYTQGLDLAPEGPDERRLVLYIGSSIGNFEPHQADALLRGVRAGLRPGDALLLGVDLAKAPATLLAAYDDAAGVTARFNLNMLARLNRELEADFDLESFAHRAEWNPLESRMEIYLESLAAQRVRVAALDLALDFAAGERIHTENSYKYRPGQAEDLLSRANFAPVQTWTDAQGWFVVCLGRAA